MTGPIPLPSIDLHLSWTQLACIMASNLCVNKSYSLKLWTLHKCWHNSWCSSTHMLQSRRSFEPGSPLLVLCSYIKKKCVPLVRKEQQQIYQCFILRKNASFVLLSVICWGSHYHEKHMTNIFHSNQNRRCSEETGTPGFCEVVRLRK